MKTLTTIFLCLLSQIAIAEYNNPVSDYGEPVSDYGEPDDEYREPIWIDPPPVLPPPVFITVDKSNFSMTTYSEGEVISKHKVIVGREDNPTPTMRAEFSQIIINPIWDVPTRLLYKLVAIIKQQRDPVAYLNLRGFEIYKDGSEIDPSTIDWRALPANGPYSFSVSQRPSSSNFIGQIQFVLEDTGDIQMHDTPDKHLFLQDVRTFSSGCIRVENAVQLAEFLLDRDVAELIEQGETVLYQLPRPVTVSIVD